MSAAALDYGDYEYDGANSTAHAYAHLLSEGEVRALARASVAVSAVSFATCAALVACYAVLPELRQFAFTLVALLCVCDGCAAATNLLGAPADGSALCEMQAVLGSFFSLAAVLWTAVIASVLKQGVVSPQALGNMRKRAYAYHLFCWGTAAAAACLPALTASYGAAGAVCWIVGSALGQALRFVTFYFPLYLVIAYNAWAYWSVVQVVRSARGLADEERRRAAALLSYPAILLVAWAGGTLNRLHNWAYPGQPSFGLYMVATVMGASQGLMHAVAFGATRAVRDALARWRSEVKAGGWRGAGARAALAARRGRAGEGLEMQSLKREDGGEGGARLGLLGDDLDSGGGGLVDVSSQVRSAHVAALGIYESLSLLSSQSVLAYEALAAAGRGTKSGGEHGDARGKGDSFATAVTLIKSFIGLGILAFPKAFSSVGYVGGCVGVLVIAGISLHGMQLLLDVQARLSSGRNGASSSAGNGIAGDGKPAGGLQSYELVSHSDARECDAGEGITADEGGASEAGPRERASRTLDSYTALGEAVWGSAGRKIVEFGLFTSQVGFGTAYLIFIGHNVFSVIPELGSPQAATLLATLFLYFPCCLPDVRRLASTSLVANALTVFSLGFVLYCALKVLRANGHQTRAEFAQLGVEPLRVAGGPYFFASTVFAFEGIGLVLPVQQSMQRPQELPGMLRYTVVSVAVVMLCLGGFCYLAWGDATRDMITLNLPQDSVLSAMVKLIYSFALGLTYPLQLLPAFRIVEDSGLLDRLVVPPSLEASMPRLRINVMRVCLVTVTSVVAALTPHFGLFVNLVGAVSCSLLAFILPAAMHFGFGATRAVRAKDGLLILFGIAGGAVSFVLTVKELIAAFAAGGGD